MDEVRIGVVGVGGMGKSHALTLKGVLGARLAGVCDVSAERVRKVAAELNCAPHTDYREFITRENCDAVVIATPHFFHPDIAIHAFGKGIHVLSEKPVAVHVKDAGRMLAAHRGTGLRFGVMYQMRLDPAFNKARQLVASGQIGTIRRTNWIITNWFRTQAYFDSATWRGTWKGEGGGLLMNQCPHQFDLFQWICGMPQSVRGFCKFGHSHRIEVEDEVTAYFEYANGATGVFVSSTGEYPGADRLEIVGDRGRIVIEDSAIKNFVQTEASVAETIRTSKRGIDKPASRDVPCDVAGEKPGWKGVLSNFIAAVRDESVALVCTGEEAVNATMLCNSILYSSVKDETVRLPLDGDLMEQCLNKLIKESVGGKAATA